jgi:hypothetical protein
MIAKTEQKLAFGVLRMEEDTRISRHRLLSQGRLGQAFFYLAFSFSHTSGQPISFKAVLNPG